MYNRYICNDNGTYTHIREEDEQRPPVKNAQAPPEPAPPPFQDYSAPTMESSSPKQSNGRMNDGLTGFLRHILDQLHLDSIDTGDLLLLGLLFFLSREDADEELLIALGLLLIL